MLEEVALLESGLLQMAPDAMIVVDQSSRIVQANTLAERLFGYPPGALTSQPLDILIPARLRDLHHRHVTDHLHNPQHRPMDTGPILWGLRRDGSEFAAQISLNLLPTPSGIHVLAAIRDLSEYRRIQQDLEQATTELERQVAARNAELLQANAELRQRIAEREQTEAALRETEALYRHLVESQPDLICRFLPDTTLTFVNTAYARFFSHPPEKLIGKRFIEFLCAEEQMEVWTHLAACTPEAPGQQYEHKTLQADGVPCWHLWHDFAFFDEHGTVIGFQSVGVDITGRKQTEVRLQITNRALQMRSACNQALVYATDEVALLGEICRIIVEVSGYRLAWVGFMEHDDAKTVRPVSQAGYEADYLKAVRITWIDEEYGQGPTGTAIRTGQPVVARNLMTDTHYTPWRAEALKRGYASSIALPLRQEGQPFGALNIYAVEPDAFTAEKVRLLAEIADDLAYGLSALRARAARKQAEQALFAEKERAQVTLHSIGDAVITTDGHAIVDYLNPVAEALTGWTMAEAQGKPLSEMFQIVNEQTREPAPDPVARCLQEGKIVGLANHTVLIDRHGREYHIDDSAAPIWGRDGRVLGVVLVFHDVTENRRLTRQLEYDATHDALTGLINRTEFERRLDRALTSAQQYGARHALCYLDLDQFKVVNDTAGHAAGDELLRQINSILTGMFRERDTLARIGGDEFGLLLDNCPLERAQTIAQTVVNRIRGHRFNWEGRIYQIGVSVGLVPITAETQDTAELFTQADIACYIAKEMGRNRVHLYHQQNGETALRHGEILGAAGLRDALERDRFRLHYQPIVPLTTPDPRPVRYEALLRVAYKSSPEATSELVLPAAFIPAAERFGLMDAIDRWVIQAAFREYAAGIGQTGARLAINLSGNSLSDETLLDFIEAQFAEYAFPPEQVCFEITETAAIQNLRHALELMAALKRRGSQFALDDFGSGLSSFHYLKTLPVDYLKIDGSFVKDMIENANDCALVAAINQMSHTLGIQTIAEYTHSQAIAERLHELGVDYAQGYFFGQPAPWGQQS